VLLAILVYGGAEFVPACIQSAAGLRAGPNRVDVLVLDDCSPDVAWSEDIERLCASLDVDYYRSPRNIGIPRAMSLAMSRAMAEGYDYVLIANSDVVFPLNLVTATVRLAAANPDVGSVTAWSNNVSIFSLPTASPFIRDQDVVDWLSYQLDAEFGDFGLEIPTAVGFCMLVPTPVVERVGLCDPVFGRGYCEEVDWSRRAAALGYRSLLSPSAFVFHLGGASTLAAGVLSGGSSTVAEHERIVNFRHPTYRADVDAFVRSGTLAPVIDRATRAVVLEASRRWGYHVEATSLRASAAPGVPFLVFPTGDDLVFVGHYGGFAAEVAVAADGDPAGALVEILGRRPDRVILFDRGRNADRVAQAEWGPDVVVEDRHRYPQRVW